MKGTEATMKGTEATQCYSQSALTETGAPPSHTGHLDASPAHAAPALSTTHIPTIPEGAICSLQLSPQILKSRRLRHHSLTPILVEQNQPPGNVLRQRTG